MRYKCKMLHRGISLRRFLNIDQADTVRAVCNPETFGITGNINRINRRTPARAGRLASCLPASCERDKNPHPYTYLINDIHDSSSSDVYCLKRTNRLAKKDRPG